MRSALSRFELARPLRLKDALQIRSAGPITPIAGCTDVYVSLQFGQAADTRYVSLELLRELRYIRAEGDGLRIGALTTYTDIIRDPLIARRLPILAQAAREIGGIQIQNRGTIGGNIANASPAGDSLPVLAVAEATIVLQSTRGERRVPFLAFYTGYRKSVLRDDELITAIEIPPIEGGQWFRKVGTRAAQAISKIVIAGVKSAQPRIAVGSVAPTVIRLPQTEAALARGVDAREAQRIVEQEIRPIDDLRSTAEYRRRVTGNLVARWWSDSARA
ncbi:MAG: xanthine dehydrogenase family protein subunit M [Gemmatimonadota bacterium]